MQVLESFNIIYTRRKNPSGFALKPEGLHFYRAPMQLVAPSAVTIAVAILAIIWMMNLNVSFLLITHLLPLVHV